MAGKGRKKHLETWIVSVAVVVVVLIAGVFAYGRYSGNNSAAGAGNKTASPKNDHYVLKLADESGVCEAPQQIAISKGFF